MARYFFGMTVWAHVSVSRIYFANWPYRVRVCVSQQCYIACMIFMIYTVYIMCVCVCVRFLYFNEFFSLTMFSGHLEYRLCSRSAMRIYVLFHGFLYDGTTKDNCATVLLGMFYLIYHHIAMDLHFLFWIANSIFLSICEAD